MIRPLSSLALLAATTALGACVFWVVPPEGGDVCRLRTSGDSECARCVERECQRVLDDCCFDASCNGLTSVIERCANARDESCAAIDARRVAPDGREARLATCTMAKCGDVCRSDDGPSVSRCQLAKDGVGCDCETTAPYNQVTCTEASFPNTVCCGPPAYPSASLACACAPFVCVPSGSGCFCSLNPYAEPGFTSTCGGAGLVCCSYNGTCTCKPGTNCEAPTKQVESCSAAAAECPSEKKRIRGCSVKRLE